MMSDQEPGTNTNNQPSQEGVQQTTPAPGQVEPSPDSSPSQTQTFSTEPSLDPPQTQTFSAGPSPDPSQTSVTVPAPISSQQPSQDGNTSTPSASMQEPEVSTSPASISQLVASLNDNSLLSDPIFAAIHNAFLVGWNLLELKSRLLLAACQVDTPEKQVSAFDLIDTLLDEVRSNSRDDDEQKLPIEPSDAVWNTSVWRAMFNRIVVLQAKRFPFSSTARTIYDVPSASYNYLFEGNAEIFTSIGISSTDLMTLGAQKDFKLYDATRRLLNCLSLLYIQPNDSLDVTTVTNYQGQIQTIILEQQPFPLKKDLNTAIKRFTGVTVRFLEAWDSFLRERYYVGRDFENFETEMIAYEAGRSMTSLSWGIALKTVPLENALEENPADISVMQQLYTAWKNVFNNRDIIHIQHQIYTLSTDMDAAYNRVKQKSQQLADGTNLPSVPLDTSPPSAALHAIKNSLDYWQSAIEWLGSATAQASICQAYGITSEKPILPPQLTKQLRVALISQADIWQSLITAQQNLSIITTETVTQKILSDFMADCEKAVMTDIVDETEGTIKKYTRMYRTALVLISVITAVLLVLFIAFVLLPATNALANVIISLFSFLGIGFIVQRLNGLGVQVPSPSSRLSSSRPNTLAAPSTTPSMFARLGNIVGMNEPSIFDIFQRSSRAVQNEFDMLNRNVSVANPLVDFFITNSNQNSANEQQSGNVNSASSTNNPASAGDAKSSSGTGNTNSPAIKKSSYAFTITDSYSFLKSIVWTSQERAQEIQNIVRTAFGPIGALVGARLNKSGSNS